MKKFFLLVFVFVAFGLYSQDFRIPNGKYREISDHQSFIGFSGSNVIEKWRSARDGKHVKIAPLSGTYTLSVENKVNFLNVTWKNNIKEKFLVLISKRYDQYVEFFLYNADGKPCFIGISCDDGEYFGEHGMEGDIGMANYTFEISGISASSSLREGSVSFTPDKINLNANEAWSEGVRGNGIGEYIIINKHSAMQVDLYISFGFVSYSKPNLFTDNARPKKIRVSWADINRSQSLVIELADTPNFQHIKIPMRDYNPDDYSYSGPLKIEILEVYPGAKYTDTCIFAAYTYFSQ